MIVKGRTYGPSVSFTIEANGTSLRYVYTA